LVGYGYRWTAQSHLGIADRWQGRFAAESVGEIVQGDQEAACRTGDEIEMREGGVLG
jgi:hypothetical protein